MKRSRKITFTLLLLITFLITGCAGRKAVVKDTFLLNAQRSGSPASAASGPVLMVRPFSIAPAYAGRDLVRKIAANQLESDYYNEYFVSPAQMLTDLTRSWIDQSGLFQTVLPATSSIRPAMSLEAHIEKLLADMPNETNPQAKLEISFILIEHNKRQQTIHFQKSYTWAHPMTTLSWPDYIIAQNACLTQILTELEKDLTANLKK